MAKAESNGGEEQVAGGPGVAVYQGLPDVKMVVAPENVVVVEGVEYGEGEEVTVDGPTAIALAGLGHATNVEEPPA